MANVVLFHSVYGLRPGLLASAGRLREHGHSVETPDLYDRAVFDSRDEARQYQASLGIEVLMRRAGEAVARLPADLVYSGFSMGSAIAEILVLSRPGAVAALLFSGAMAVDESETGPWPPRVPVEVHYAAGDPLVEQRELDSLERAVTAGGGTFHAYGYPVAGHLFADPGLPDYDADSAEQMWQRAEAFLDALR